jgi:hypothetical protein
MHRVLEDFLQNKDLGFEERHAAIVFVAAGYFDAASKALIKAEIVAGGLAAVRFKDTMDSEDRLQYAVEYVESMALIMAEHEMQTLCGPCLVHVCAPCLVPFVLFTRWLASHTTASSAAGVALPLLISKASVGLGVKPACLAMPRPPRQHTPPRRQLSMQLSSLV